jgi:hypothetical protein
MDQLRAASPSHSFRPEIQLASPSLPALSSQSPAPTPSTDFARLAATRAASRSSWQFVSPLLRADIATRLHQPLSSVVIRFSGTDRGNAEQLDDHQSRCRGTTDGAPWHFVIGNGRRSPDGSIETTRRWLRDSSGSELTVCLIGSPDSLTPAQQNAIGELLLFLESRSGTLALRSAAPSTPEMLAAAD